MQEVWKKIRIDSKYEVSSLGRVRNTHTGHFVTLYGRKCKSKFCTLSENSATHTYSVARLMVMAFYPEKASKQKYKVCFKDGEYENLTLDNLEIKEINTMKNHLLLKKYLHILLIDIEPDYMPDLKRKWCYDISVTNTKSYANMRYINHVEEDGKLTLMFVECYENVSRGKFLDLSSISTGFKHKLIDEEQYNAIMLYNKNITESLC